VAGVTSLPVAGRFTTVMVPARREALVNTVNRTASAKCRLVLVIMMFKHPASAR